MLKYITLFAVLSVWLISCEEPVHEEYDLYGAPSETENPGGEEEQGVYFPLAVGNKWVYEVEQNGQTVEQESYVTGTEEIEGETYYAFNPEYQEGTTVYNYIRKDGDDYIYTVQSNTGALSSNYFSQIIMKDNVSVGDTWTSQYSVIYDLNGTTLEYPYTVNYEVQAIHDTYEVNGTEYQQVAEVQSQSTGSGTTVNYTVFYALNIGIIKKITDSGEAIIETNLISYELQ